MTYQEIEALPIYFILAKGRSGTTLLQTMIDAHPNTIAPTESRFLVHFQNKYKTTKRWTDAKKESFYEDITKEHKIALFWNLDTTKLKAYLKIIPENTSYEMICKTVYLSFNSIFDKKKPCCIVDKNPVYSWLIPILIDIVPNAKFIHLIRDSRACVNSTISFRTKNAKSVAKSWSTNNAYVDKFKAKQAEAFHTLHYESVIRNSEKSMKELCDFLNVDYSSDMLQYHKQVKKSIGDFLTTGESEETNKIRKEGFEKVHKNLVKPLDPSRIDSWKSKLSEEDILKTQQITGHLLFKYGYFHSKVTENSRTTYYSKLFTVYKTQLYYKLPIWLRELKSRPELTFLESQPKELILLFILQ